MANRWWVYQRERFPLVSHGLLVIVFVCAVLLFSAQQSSDAQLPEIFRFLAAAGSVIILFFQLRVADEFKDFDVDTRYRPHRAVPRGLVSLHELAVFAYVGAAIQFVFAISISVGLVPVLVVVWGWMWLMYREFFCPEWLRHHPVAYLLSHMIIMPFVTFYASAFDWLGTEKGMPAGLGLLLTVSFFGGLVLELGRKIRTPANERSGVETYSALWGTRRAVAVWLVCVTAAAISFLSASRFFPASEVTTSPGLAIAGLASTIALIAGLSFLAGRHQPATAPDKRIERASGLFVLLMYGGLGPLQLLLGAWS